MLIKSRLDGYRLLLAFAVALVLSSICIGDLSAQERSNKGGEERGKDRATQVQEVNQDAKEERADAKSENKGGKEKKAKKAKKK